MTALTFAIEAFNALPGLIAAGIDIIGFINTTNDALQKMQDEDRDPSDAEWEQLNNTVEMLRAQRPDITGE